MALTRNEILALIQVELDRQEEIWGEQDHTDDRWLAILVEELGEVALAMNDGTEIEVVLELTQVAAVAAAWIENITRR